MSSESDPFFFPSGGQGVLLIHGYLSSPAEMRPLGEYLAQAGLTVLGIRLTGHGTRPEDLEDVHWQAWVADVQAGLETLRARCEQVSLAGHSLGGALALYTAAQTPVERVVAYSAPDGALAETPPLVLAEPLSHLLSMLPKIGSDVRDPAARREHLTYPRIPVKSAAQVAALLTHLDEVLPLITAPTLLIYARQDRVIPATSAAHIARRLNAPHRLLWLERGGHRVVIDYDREKAWAATRAWLSGEGIGAETE
ncbi:MAG: alpha/beta hydrolase [Anaerolineae bacterium]